MFHTDPPGWLPEPILEADPIITEEDGTIMVCYVKERFVKVSEFNWLIPDPLGFEVSYFNLSIHY